MRELREGSERRLPVGPLALGGRQVEVGGARHRGERGELRAAGCKRNEAGVSHAVNALDMEGSETGRMLGEGKQEVVRMFAEPAVNFNNERDE